MNKFAQLKKACIFVPTITLKTNTMTNSSKLIKKLNNLKEIFNLGMITEQEYKIRFAKWEQEYKELFR